MTKKNMKLFIINRICILCYRIFLLNINDLKLLAIRYADGSFTTNKSIVNNQRADDTRIMILWNSVQNIG